MVSGVPLRFCSENCQSVFHGPTKPITVLALPTRRSHDDTNKIEEGHTEICCIAGEGIVDGEGLRFKISVRVGYKSAGNPQGRYYCIWNLRTLFTLQCAELFLCRDSSPDSPLPHVDCKEGQQQIQELRDQTILQNFIQAGFRVIKKQHELNLPPNSAKVVTEQIPHAFSTQQRDSSSIHTSSSTTITEIENGYEQLRLLVPGTLELDAAH